MSEIDNYRNQIRLETYKKVSKNLGNLNPQDKIKFAEQLIDREVEKKFGKTKETVANQQEKELNATATRAPETPLNRFTNLVTDAVTKPIRLASDLAKKEIEATKNIPVVNRFTQLLNPLAKVKIPEYASPVDKANVVATVTTPITTALDTTKKMAQMVPKAQNAVNKFANIVAEKYPALKSIPQAPLVGKGLDIGTAINKIVVPGIDTSNRFIKALSGYREPGKDIENKPLQFMGEIGKTAGELIPLGALSSEKLAVDIPLQGLANVAIGNGSIAGDFATGAVGGAIFGGAFKGTEAIVARKSEKALQELAKLYGEDRVINVARQFGLKKVLKNPKIFELKDPSKLDGVGYAEYADRVNKSNTITDKWNKFFGRNSRVNTMQREATGSEIANGSTDATYNVAKQLHIESKPKNVETTNIQRMAENKPFEILPREVKNRYYDAQGNLQRLLLPKGATGKIDATPDVNIETMRNTINELEQQYDKNLLNNYWETQMEHATNNFNRSPELQQKYTQPLAPFRTADESGNLMFGQSLKEKGQARHGFETGKVYEAGYNLSPEEAISKDLLSIEKKNALSGAIDTVVKPNSFILDSADNIIAKKKNAIELVQLKQQLLQDKEIFTGVSREGKEIAEEINKIDNELNSIRKESSALETAIKNAEDTYLKVSPSRGESLSINKLNNIAETQLYENEIKNSKNFNAFNPGGFKIPTAKQLKNDLGEWSANNKGISFDEYLKGKYGEKVIELKKLGVNNLKGYYNKVKRGVDVHKAKDTTLVERPATFDQWMRLKAKGEKLNVAKTDLQEVALPTAEDAKVLQNKILSAEMRIEELRQANKLLAKKPLPKGTIEFPHWNNEKKSQELLAIPESVYHDIVPNTVSTKESKNKVLGLLKDTFLLSTVGIGNVKFLVKHLLYSPMRSYIFREGVGERETIKSLATRMQDMLFARSEKGVLGSLTKEDLINFDREVGSIDNLYMDISNATSDNFIGRSLKKVTQVLQESDKMSKIRAFKEAKLNGLTTKGAKGQLAYDILFYVGQQDTKFTGELLQKSRKLFPFVNSIATAFGRESERLIANPKLIASKVGKISLLMNSLYLGTKFGWDGIDTGVEGKEWSDIFKEEEQRYSANFFNNNLPIFLPLMKTVPVYADDGTEIGTRQAPTILTIPMPEALGYINTFNNKLRTFIGVTPKTYANQYGDDLLSKVGSKVISSVAPIYSMPFALVANKNFFTGKPIESQAMEGRSKSLRYDNNTSELAKAVGRVTGLVGLSPAQVDFIAQQIGLPISARQLKNLTNLGLSINLPGLPGAFQYENMNNLSSLTDTSKLKELEKTVKDASFVKQQGDLDKIQQMLPMVEVNQREKFLSDLLIKIGEREIASGNKDYRTYMNSLEDKINTWLQVSPGIAGTNASNQSKAKLIIDLKNTDPKAYAKEYQNASRDLKIEILKLQETQKSPNQ